VITPYTFSIWVQEQAVPLLIIFSCLVGGFLLLYISARRRRSEMVKNRVGVTEQSFVRHMAAYDFDPFLSKETYRYLQQVQLVDFPLLPGDSLDEDLGLDPDDVKESVRDLLRATGREFRPGILSSPIITVEDLVRYLQASPRSGEARELVSQAS
jgi:hypothetical protein